MLPSPSLNCAAPPFNHVPIRARMWSNSISSSPSLSASDSEDQSIATTATSQGDLDKSLHKSTLNPTFPEFIPWARKLVLYDGQHTSSSDISADEQGSDSPFSPTLASIPSQSSYTTQPEKPSDDLLLSMKYLPSTPHLAPLSPITLFNRFFACTNGRMTEIDFSQSYYLKRAASLGISFSLSTEIIIPRTKHRPAHKNIVTDGESVQITPSRSRRPATGITILPHPEKPRRPKSRKSQTAKLGGDGPVSMPGGGGDFSPKKKKEKENCAADAAGDLEAVARGFVARDVKSWMIVTEKMMGAYTP